MPIVIGLILACGLLYFWLQGHWFARILVVPIIPITALVVCAALRLGMEGDNANPLGLIVIVFLLACPIGWLIGSLPTWYWRQRMRTIAEAEMRWPRPAG